MAYIKGDRLLETSTERTNVARAKETQGKVLVEELSIRILGTEATDEIEVVGTPRKNGASTAITAPLKER